MTFSQRKRLGLTLEHRAVRASEMAHDAWVVSLSDVLLELRVPGSWMATGTDMPARAPRVIRVPRAGGPA